MSSKYSGRGSFLDVDGYGRIEVEPGSEKFVQAVLKKYMSIDSGVKITRAPNYVGRYMDQPSNKKRNKK